MGWECVVSHAPRAQHWNGGVENLNFRRTGVGLFVQGSTTTGTTQATHFSVTVMLKPAWKKKASGIRKSRTY